MTRGAYYCRGLPRSSRTESGNLVTDYQPYAEFDKMDRMHTIALISRKGGAGKTTLACALVVAAARAGHSTLLVDLDPQGSGAIWHGLRQPPTPVFTRTAHDRLTRVLRAAAKTGANLAVIDTAPDTDAGTRAAARAADVILIPCRPAAADLSAIRATVQIAQHAGTRTYAILNAAPVRNPLIDQARAALARYELEVAPVVVHNRIDHVHAFVRGLTAQEAAPRSKAAHELENLYTWIDGALREQTT